MSKATIRDSELYNPERWGLSEEWILGLADALYEIWFRFHDCFLTRTRDPSRNALTYLKGLITMPNKRNYANIARRVNGIDDDGQNLQHFMSDSPWSAQKVFAQIQQEITEDEHLHGGMLTLDESGDGRSGEHSAGAARQHIGRLGKVALGQVGVVLGYYQSDNWMMVDAELFLPEKWFEADYKELWPSLHIPPEREFKTKLEIGLELIREAKRRGLPFSMVSCDELYGRNHQFRAALSDEGLVYIADIPVNTKLYLKEPQVAIPQKENGGKGRKYRRGQVAGQTPLKETRQLIHDPKVCWQWVDIRYTERGLLRYKYAARRVWTITNEGGVQEEWLLMRCEHNGKYSFSLSNAPIDTPLEDLARWRCQRYFAERIFQDAKSEGGWDELVARKYRAWMHHTALEALVLWFIAQIKLKWARTYPPESALAKELQLTRLPHLSMANIRELLMAVMPLKQFSIEDSIRLVTKHFVHRAKSTKSRLKAQLKNRGSP